MAGISNDVENLRVNRNDFMSALDEVHPAFGVSEEELQQVVQNGIIHYDRVIDVSHLLLHFQSFLIDELNYRNFSGMDNCSLNKFERPPERHSSAFFYTDHPGLERRRWLQRSPRRLAFRSSSLYHPSLWLVLHLHRRLRRSARSSQTAIKAP